MTNEFHWPDEVRCAVSLTYDDGLPMHYEHAGPSLESAGLRGTFFAPIMSDVLHHPEKWRELAQRGHELGNHTLFHPCRRTPEREGWLEPFNDLYDYTPARLRQELEMANRVLHLIDGRTERTFGNTCCETTVGGGDQEVSMDGVLAELFVAARGPFNKQVADIGPDLNLLQVGHFGADGRTFHELEREIGGAVECGGWAVYMIHGIGSTTHNHYIDAEEHDRLISWLGEQRDTVWTAPFIEIARYVKDQTGF